MMMLAVNESVITVDVHSKKTIPEECYILRDRIDQYIIDNDIRLDK
jgi:hypothetical protein